MASGIDGFLAEDLSWSGRVGPEMSAKSHACSVDVPLCIEMHDAESHVHVDILAHT
jgi:hypothetical protein